MSTEPWTIKTICEALGNPDLTKQFLSEFNSAEKDQLVPTFEKWASRAARIQAAEQRGRELAAADDRGEELSGEWIDRTEWVQREATRIRAERGAA